MKKHRPYVILSIIAIITLAQAISMPCGQALNQAEDYEALPPFLAASGATRARAVLEEIEGRLAALGVGWADTDAVAVYSLEAVDTVLESVVLARLGDASRRGVQRYFTAPPVQGLLYEMDARGGVEEVWV